MLFVKAVRTIILGLLFLPIAGCAITVGIILLSLLKSVSYARNYIWLLVYIKAIAGSVRDYVLLLWVRTGFLMEWVKAPFAVIMFLLFVPINFILFMLYIPLFYICIFYWVYRVIHYSINPNIKEVAPYKDFTHPNSIFTTYTYYLKAQTFYKAYLVSFSVVYNATKFLLSSTRGAVQGRSKYAYLILALKLVLKVLFWLVVRVVTSLPRAVIIDSYRCSSFFIIYNAMFKQTFRRELSRKDFFRVWITSRFYTNVTFYLNDTLMPITYKRIFKTPSNKYNFNPLERHLVSKIIDKIQPKLVKVWKTSEIEKIRNVVDRYPQHGFGKSVDSKRPFHPTVVVDLRGNPLVSDDSVSSKKEFKHLSTQKNPNPIIAVSQTSSYEKNRDELNCISHTEYDQNNISTSHSRVTSTWFLPKGSYIFRPTELDLYVPGSSGGGKIRTRDVWELSGISRCDWISGVIFNSEASNKILYSLAINEVLVNPKIREVIGFLTDHRISDIIEGLTREESELIILAVTKVVYPEKFHNIVNYYTKYHIACNKDNHPHDDDDLLQ